MLDLPLRMVVTVIMGGAALVIVLSFLFQPCLFPKELQVCWEPPVIYEGREEEINVTVKNEKGMPVSKATVMISGLNITKVGETDANGSVKIYIKAFLQKYRNEGYLDLYIKAGSCYKKFCQENAIKVVRG